MPSRITVLVVDDDRVSADLTVDVLRSYGFDVHVAYDERGALEAASRHLPHVVVCDIQMPGISGPQLVATLGHLGDEQTRFLFLTGMAPGELPTDLPRHDAVLHKPVAPEQLLDALAAIVDLDRP